MGGPLLSGWSPKWKLSLTCLEEERVMLRNPAPWILDSSLLVSLQILGWPSFHGYMKQAFKNLWNEFLSFSFFLSPSPLLSSLPTSCFFHEQCWLFPFLMLLTVHTCLYPANTTSLCVWTLSLVSISLHACLYRLTMLYLAVYTASIRGPQLELGTHSHQTLFKADSSIAFP